MFRSLKRITSINLQTHECVVLDDLPETGLIRFRGDNSEGKSVIVKVLFDSISCVLHRKKYRNPLIRYGQDSGQLILESHSSALLIINLDREASKTYYELREVNEEPLRRYLSDKNVQELVWRFGFHYLPERNFSLNIYNTYDPLLFLNTSGRLNLDVWDSVTTDQQAEKAIKNIDETLEQLKSAYDQSSKDIDSSQTRLSALRVWNIDQQASKKEKLDYYAINIQGLETPDIPDIEAIPNLDEILALDTTNIRNRLKEVSFPKDEVFEVLDKIESLSFVTSIKLPNVSKEMHELLEYTAALENEECPVCGRSYSLHESVQIAL